MVIKGISTDDGIEMFYEIIELMLRVAGKSEKLCI
jgi:hypothetical protein